jgi:hypothetical protein
MYARLYFGLWLGWSRVLNSERKNKQEDSGSGFDLYLVVAHCTVLRTVPECM